MKIDFMAEAQSLREKLISLREEFHQTPELGNHEFKTAELIEKVLDEAKIPHKRILDTGIVARVEGKLPGRHSAIRADIDALPITEATGAKFSSRNPGFMHACGHDVHVTGALGAATILQHLATYMHGSATFLFQPDEEGDGGADRMIKAGGLEDVDAVFGCHVDPALPAGHVGVRYGNFYAASAMFKIAIIGKSVHGAQRDKGIDAIEVSANIIPKVLKIPGGVVSVGKLNAGTAGNILAGRAEFAGIIRTFGVDERARMCREFQEICEQVCASFGARCECDFNLSCPGVINDNDALTSLVEETAREALGSERVHRIEKPLFISEDFGFYIMARTGNFYHVGAGCECPLHSNNFLPDPDAIITASALHAAVVEKFNSQD
ncbi:MAG: amidohydrolase [Synergistaceae bacterium]|nr:amidohydrolase [Synergistaceae bacterium]MBR0094438.1 amidohydrolase [Synergistaceae bacterium]